jgi:tryptophan synthase
VSVSGVTGARSEVSQGLNDLVNRIRSVSGDIPLAVGFGVATRDHFLQVAKHAEGKIFFKSQEVEYLVSNNFYLF